MERIVKVPYQGLTVDGIEVDFKALREEWNEYEASDGSTVRLKVIVTNIVRLKDKFDSVDNPIYVVKSSNVLSTSVSEKSKKGTTVS